MCDLTQQILPLAKVYSDYFKIVYKYYKYTDLQMKFVLIVLFLLTNGIVIHSLHISSSYGYDFKGNESKSCHRHLSLKDITWMHVPKCGSSFSLVLQHVSCPFPFEEISRSFMAGSETIKHGEVNIPNLDIVCPHNFHDIPYHGSLCPHDFENSRNRSIRLVTVLRNPVDRMHSARRHSFMIITDNAGRVIANDVDRDAVLETQVPKENEVVRKAMKAANVKDSPNNQLFEIALKSYRYQSSSRVKGVYTKTLIGRLSGEDYTLTQADVDLAISNLERFYFVGIFETWNNTIECYLHRESNILGYQLNVTQLDLLQVRPTKVDHDMERIVSFFPPFIDIHDNQVYEAAKRMHSSKCHHRSVTYHNKLPRNTYEYDYFVLLALIGFLCWIYKIYSVLAHTFLIKIFDFYYKISLIFLRN